MTLREVTGPSDPAFERAMRLYEASFVPDERVDADAIRRRLGGGPRFALLEALVEGRFAGFAMLDAFEPRPGRLVGLILYFAILPELRGSGLGQALYRLILERFAQQSRALGLAFEGLLFEVERPELAADEADRQLRERRIAFYRRLGARPLEGIDYVQPALGEGKRPVRMHLFYHPAESPPERPHGPEGLDDAELYREFVRQLWGVEP